MKQMVDAYSGLGGNLVCALEIPLEDTPSYGVIDPGERNGPITEVRGLVEKPAAGTAPSNLILPGRYILQPEVMRILETQEAGAGRRDPADRCDGADDRQTAVSRHDL